MTATPAPQPRILSSRLIHRGKKFNFATLTIAHPSGKTIDREIVRHPGAVVIVPILTPPGAREPHIVLIRNFRITVGEHLLECCAGTIEREQLPDGSFTAGESPDACAARELIEETGYRAGSLHSLGWYYTTPGLTDEKMHAYLATNLTHVGQQLEEDETIEVVTMPASLVLEKLRRGEIRDGKSIVALYRAREREWQ